MYLSIAYHARPEVIKARINIVIEFLDSYYLGLGSGD